VHVSCDVSSCENDVSELLDGSELVESRFIEELASEVHHLGRLDVTTGYDTLL
jgi:hypothetical protein